MAFQLRLTDRNGNSSARNLSAKTRAKAWDCYTQWWDNYEVQLVELWQDDTCIGRTEHKLAGTPDAYRVSTT